MWGKRYLFNVIKILAPLLPFKFGRAVSRETEALRSPLVVGWASKVILSIDEFNKQEQPPCFFSGFFFQLTRTIVRFWLK